MQSFNSKFRGNDYLEQWERVRRWHRKVKEVEENIYQNNGVSIEEQEDYLYIFFLQLYNLKDWIKKSAKNTAIENLFSKDTGVQNFMIVADFVNNVKHFDNSKCVRLSTETFLISRDAQSGGGGPVHTWWIQTSQDRVNVYILVDEVYCEMEKFMMAQNLLKNEQ